MNKTLGFYLSGLAFSLTLATGRAATTEPDALMNALELTRPELAKVKAAADQGDFPAARKAFADHLRTRTSVLWHFDPANPPKQITPEELQEARDTMQHKFNILDVPWQFNGPIDWRFNPTTLPDSKVPVTHEWTWGLNRHPYWPALAKAFLATGDPAYAREVSQEIADWCARNPAPDVVPPRYFSPWRQIEAGLRMGRSWPETFFLLLRSPDVFPDDAMLAMVETMGDHATYLEKYPTTGNWKTMESNGLFHVGTLFPEFKDAGRWRTVGLNRQREELDAQVYPDGVQIELTSGYHNVALRMFLSTLRLAELNSVPVPAGYKNVLERMFDMNFRALLPDRTLPDFNDSGREGALDMLEQGLELFPNRADWKWIVTNGKEGAKPAETSHFFPYAGWAVMRSDWTPDARSLIMEGGPFGYGHQHEDKLSFILYAYGSRLVAEAGIFPYFQSKSRDYSIAAPGHNVLSVDGLQQSRRGRPRETYITKAPLDLNWRSTPEFDYVEASYGRGDDETWGDEHVRGFVHTRRILFARPDYWVIIDSIVPPDKREHTYESAFHLDADDARIDDAAKRVTTTGHPAIPDNPTTAPTSRATVSVVPLPTKDLTVRVVKGQKKPELLGWIANDTLELQPVPTACYTRHGKGPLHTLYVFAPAPPGQDSPVARVEPAKVNGASVAASIVFKDQAPYGHGTDKVSLTSDGAVVIQRAGGANFSSRNASPKP